MASSRRTEYSDGVDDEALEADFSWKSTSLIVEWEAGNGVYELVEVSQAQADKIIGYFRNRWSRDTGNSA